MVHCLREQSVPARPRTFGFGAFLHNVGGDIGGIAFFGDMSIVFGGGSLSRGLPDKSIT